MLIRLELDADDSNADATDDTGLTGEAFDRLVTILNELGYSITDGPERL